MTKFDKVKTDLLREQHTWCVTGVAGFIGSNILEILLKLNQKVVGLDNFSTGYQKNLDEVKAAVSTTQWAYFSFIKGDIRIMYYIKQPLGLFLAHWMIPLQPMK